MSVETRIRHAIGSIVDGVPVTPPPFASLRPAQSPPPRRWRGPVFAGAAVLLLILLVTVAPGAVLPSWRTGPGAGSGPATLPARFAGMSLLTAPVSTAPPGPAIAVYTAGALGMRGIGTTQVVAVGVDGRTYRRVDVAEDDGSSGADGEWSSAPTRLSRDGRVVAVAAGDRTVTEVKIVDLTTGRVRAVPLGGELLVRLMDWSPDGTKLALLLAVPGAPPLDGPLTDGRLAVLDVGTGALRRYDDLGAVRGPAAFSPGGDLLAVGMASGARVIDVGTGRTTATVALPEGNELSDAATWSPDGRLLVVVGLGTTILRFVDATGGNDAVPAPIDVEGEWVYPVAWRSADSLLIFSAGSGDSLIVERPIGGGAGRTVSRLPNGLLSLGRVDRVQLAAELVPPAVIRKVGDPARGPWPTWWRVVLGVAVVTVGLLVVRWIRRRQI
jgi:hypothetical protein